jgi:hypothetical protein
MAATDRLIFRKTLAHHQKCSIHMQIASRTKRLSANRAMRIVLRRYVLSFYDIYKTTSEWGENSEERQHSC